MGTLYLNWIGESQDFIMHCSRLLDVPGNCKAKRDTPKAGNQGWGKLSEMNNQQQYVHAIQTILSTYF